MMLVVWFQAPLQVRLNNFFPVLLFASHVTFPEPSMKNPQQPHSNASGQRGFYFHARQLLFWPKAWYFKENIAQESQRHCRSDIVGPHLRVTC